MASELAPPDGYESWLEYAVDTMDTRDLFLDHASGGQRQWMQAMVDRLQMADAAQAELDATKTARAAGFRAGMEEAAKIASKCGGSIASDNDYIQGFHTRVVNAINLAIAILAAIPANEPGGASGGKAGGV